MVVLGQRLAAVGHGPTWMIMMQGLMSIPSYHTNVRHRERGGVNRREQSEYFGLRDLISCIFKWGAFIFFFLSFSSSCFSLDCTAQLALSFRKQATANRRNFR